MTKHRAPQEVYTQNVNDITTTLTRLKKSRSALGWIRLVNVLAILLLIYYLFFNSTIIIWLLLAVSIAAFLFVLTKDTDNNAKIAELERLLSINQSELAILEGKYVDREDGSFHVPAEHPYANDIDLFGKASLYQYINRCTSEQSKKRLASYLLQPLEKSVIIEQQEAAKALKEHTSWRQQLQSAGIANPLTVETEQKITSWLALPTPFKTGFWQLAPHIFTAITLFTLGLYLFDYISSAFFTLFVFVFFLFAKYTSGKVITTYLALMRIENEVNTIQQQLKLLEQIPASSELLNNYRQLLSSGKNGSESIKELKKILNKLDVRLNVFLFLVLNTFFLWDVRQMNSLNKWKEKNAERVPEWFNMLANIEVLNTLATLTFNHPAWVFPVINGEHFNLHAEQVGHPLINAAKRVDNSFSTNGTGKVSIITGSNMAGKSTFLRSIAVNMVLAQMGAPVCAKSFTCSTVKLYTSMRIADNLAENTSTFYAELKKLKTIIDQVKQHEKVFILLDEILRGTNSLDRHTGSEALIRQLIKENAVAVIATHDVELAALNKEYVNEINNYHFDVQVEGEELYFDYRLKSGVCQSLNASLLMKKIGIEI